MIIKSIHQGDITTVNIYTPNIAAPKYVKQMLKILRENRQQYNSREI